MVNENNLQAPSLLPQGGVSSILSSPLGGNEGGYNNIPPIIEIGDVLVSMNCITEMFCCDLDACHGVCCIEGDAGAPVTIDEIMEIEDAVDVVWSDMSAGAQAVIDKQGVAYVDQTGELVTSIVNNRDCAFTCHENGCCLCLLEKAYREGKTSFCKPISCSLYPIREKKFNNGFVGLNYDRWNICEPAVKKGKELQMPVYKFLKAPLIRRFGKEWYDELDAVAKEIVKAPFCPPKGG